MVHGVRSRTLSKVCASGQSTPHSLVGTINGSPEPVARATPVISAMESSMTRCTTVLNARRRFARLVSEPRNLQMAMVLPLALYSVAGHFNLSEL